VTVISANTPVRQDEAGRFCLEVLTPTDLNAMLDKPMQITVREYLALTQGKCDPQAALQALIK
jgi:hypothetical protein